MMASGPREKVGMKSIFHLDGIYALNLGKKLFKRKSRISRIFEKTESLLYEVRHDREKSKRDFDVFGKESWI